MIEDILIQDMEDRGVGVRRSSPFTGCERLPSGKLRVEYEDATHGSKKTILSDYLVGCDGARSRVREFIPDAQLEGDMTNASWGVLDGNFPPCSHCCVKSNDSSIQQASLKPTSLISGAKWLSDLTLQGPSCGFPESET